MNATDKQQSETESMGSIWYGTRSDPLLALQPVLWFRDPSGRIGILETEGTNGTEPESCVMATLRAAGLVGGPGTLSRLRLLDDERQCVRHHGFDVPSSRWGRVDSTMRELLMQGLGGWTEVLSGQTCFHAPAYMTQVFAVLWATAGRPPVQVAHHLSPAPKKTAGVPTALAAFPLADRRMALHIERYGKPGSTQANVFSDQKTLFEFQQPVEIAPEACEFCGGKLYEADGHYWCANAPTRESKPDLEHE